MSQILKANEIDISKIRYSEIKVIGTSGAKQLYMNYASDKAGSRDLQFPSIHTPKMRIPYGPNKYEEPGKAPKYTLQMSFGDMESNQKLKQFYEALTQIEENLIKEAMKNSLNWFKKKQLSETVARTLFSSSIKHSTDKETGEVNDKYPPTLKVKLNFVNDNFDCHVFDHNRNKVEGDFTKQITKGQSVTSIIKSGGVWFSGGKFGCTWKVEQLKLDKPSSLIGYAFIEDEDENDFKQ